MDDWKQFFKKHNIDYADFYIEKNKNKLPQIAKKLGFPLVLKAYDMKKDSKPITHKSDYNAVIFVNNEKELKDAIKQLDKLPKGIKFTSYLLQKLTCGREIIISCAKDPTFGSFIMLGIGGRMVEAIKDVTYGINPIDRKTAQRMVDELKSNKVLGKFRGERDARKNIVDLLVKLSSIAHKEQKEFEFNPVVITEKSLKVVDFR